MSAIKVFWKPWEKEELLETSNSSLFPPCFLPFWRTSCHFHQIYNCRLQTLSVWKSPNLSFGKGLRWKILMHNQCRRWMNDTVEWKLILWTLKLLTHYQMTNFRLFQTERVCRQQFQICQKWQKVIQTGRKHCGKRRNCSLWAISPFPTVFSKGLFPRGIRSCHYVGMS